MPWCTIQRLSSALLYHGHIVFVLLGHVLHFLCLGLPYSAKTLLYLLQYVCLVINLMILKYLRATRYTCYVLHSTLIFVELCLYDALVTWSLFDSMVVEIHNMIHQTHYTIPWRLLFEIHCNSISHDFSSVPKGKFASLS